MVGRRCACASLSHPTWRHRGGPMQDHEKTKEQLIEELVACRRRMAALERAESESHSDRQRVEAALEQERNLLHTLMDHLPDNIYFKDAASRFIRISKAMATQFGLGDPAEAVGKTDFDFFTDEHARQAMADEEEILRSGRAVIDKEEKETWPDGHTTWTLTTKMPLCDEQGRTVGTFGLSRDVTERRHAAEALERAKEEAEAASRAKSTFLANTSHEIRTPLNAIMGMTELVLKSQLTPRQREFLVTVRDSGEALLAVINDILDFSRIEAGKLVLERQTFDLRESLGDTMKSFAIAAAAAGPGTGVLHPSRGAADGRRRLRSSPPDRRQPGRQRHQVHPARRSDPRSRPGVPLGKRRPVRRGRPGRGAALDGQRHGNGHPRRAAIGNLPDVRAGRQLHDPPLRRGGPGTGHRLTAGRPDAGPHLGRERSRPGKRVPLHRPARAGRARGRPGVSAGARGPARHCACWRWTTMPPTGGSWKRSSAAGEWSRPPPPAPAKRWP